MALITTYGGLQNTSNGQSSWQYSSGSVAIAGRSLTYAKIYETQPNVRICVDFLARNVAQIGLHVFRTVTDTDRERLRDHQLADWLKRPNPYVTSYRLKEALMQDLGLYLNAYWLKVRLSEHIALVRIPPHQMRVEGGLLPSHFVRTLDNGEQKELAMTEVVHFSGYNPSNPLMGLSPLETLRQLLAEERAAADHRSGLWANSARIGGVIQVNAAGPDYTPDNLRKYREQWQEAHAGAQNAGKTAILPRGMEFKEASFSSKDSEYVASRKLNREEVAAAFHIPLPLVGILDHATFSNIKEQHKQLYQDTLGPWLEMIEQEIERQLLVECKDQDGVYVEFNIAEKLKGSFEEQASSLQTLVGRPVMTVDEGRARLNLSATGDPEDAKVAKPLNMSGAEPKRLPPANDEDADA